MKIRTIRIRINIKRNNQKIRIKFKNINGKKLNKIRIKIEKIMFKIKPKKDKI